MKKLGLEDLEAEIFKDKWTEFIKMKYEQKIEILTKLEQNGNDLKLEKYDELCE